MRRFRAATHESLPSPHSCSRERWPRSPRRRPSAGRSGGASGATVLRRTVAIVGHYRVVVGLRTRGRGPEMVTVYLTGHAARRIRVVHAHASRLTYTLVVTRSTRLTVEAVSTGPAVHVTVKTTLRA